MSLEVSKASGALGDKFQFSVQNKNAAGGQALRVAIVPAYFDTLGISAEIDEDEETVNVATHHHNTTALKAAGYSVDRIIDDDMSDKEVAIQATNSERRIRDFLDFVKTNEVVLRSMTIKATSTDAFDGDMEVSHLNPFKKVTPETIELNKFFSRFQENDDKIDIDFENDNMIINDTLLWVVNVPANTTMVFTLRF